MYVVRVPTKENLADDPSRERYGLLARMKVNHIVMNCRCVPCECVWCQATRALPVLDSRFFDAQLWESLAVR